MRTLIGILAIIDALLIVFLFFIFVIISPEFLFILIAFIGLTGLVSVLLLSVRDGIIDVNRPSR